MTALDLIQLRFPNRGLLSLAEACQLLGISAATARNQICQGRKAEQARSTAVSVFPVPVATVNGRLYVSVLDLAGYLELVYRQATETVGRGPGRPSKAEKAARSLAAKKAIRRVTTNQIGGAA